MADKLTLKVPEAEYRETLTELKAAISGLEGCLGKLQGERANLEKNFISAALSLPLREMIKGKEKEVRGSIESIQTQIEQIELFLQEMSVAENEVDSKIKEAANTVVEQFI